MRRAAACGLGVVFLAWSAPCMARPPAPCQNPGGLQYTKTWTPAFSAPDATRAEGLFVEVDKNPHPVVDVRAACLPLAARYNNPGAVKTRASGYWPGQTKKDGKGHAVFSRLPDGVTTWMTWIQARHAEGKNTAFALMSIYAPPDDCIGSVDKLPNGQCPPGYPLNPTAAYAARVAAVAGVGPDDPLDLDGRSCSGRAFLRAFFEEVMIFEMGRAFCHDRCAVAPSLIDVASDAVWGKAPQCK